MAEAGTENKPDTTTADVDAAKARAADLQKELDRVTKKLQGKLDEEEKAKQAALAEQGKFKELYEQSEQKLKAELDPLKAEIERFRKIEKAEKDALLTKLPEEQREKWGKADIELLRDHVATLESKGPTLPGKKPGADNLDGKKWEDLSVSEQEDLQVKDYPAYVRLYNDYQRRRGGKVMLK